MLRGAAILAVLYLHAYFRTWPEVTEGERLGLLISHLFAHGAVPVFLFISGFLLARDRSPSFAAFAAGRLRRVAAPGLLWMLVALAYESWRAGGVSEALVWRFVRFDIEGQFYFLLVLAILMAAAHPLRKAPVRRLAVVTGVVFFAGLAMVAWYEGRRIEGDLAVFAYRNPVVWAHFFLFGLLTARWRGRVTWGRPAASAAVLAMAVVLAWYVWGGERTGYPTSYFGVSVYLFSSLGLLVYPTMAAGIRRVRGGMWLARPLEWLAPLSFGMFLVHKPYFLGWMSSTVLAGTRLEESWGRLMVANFVLGAAGTALAVWAVSRAWPAGASLFLGVDRPEAGRR